HDKSSYEVDSEFNTKFECVDKASTTNDVERQSSPTRKTEVVSIAPSGPVRTAPQGNKPVSKLQLKLGKETEKFSPIIEGRHGSEVLSTTEEESWTPEWIPTYIGRHFHKQMVQNWTPEWIPTYIGRQIYKPLYVCGGWWHGSSGDRFKPSLNCLKGGGGQAWMMEWGKGMSLEDACLLKLIRNRSGRRSGVPPTSIAGLAGAGELTLDPTLVRLKPSNETTKTSRVLGLSIVETKRFHERATEG
ncbi:hypothetical protein HID58_004777, partial [Brassica napus]